MRSLGLRRAKSLSLMLLGAMVIVTVAGLVGPLDGMSVLSGTSSSDVTTNQAQVLGTIELPQADPELFIANAVTIERAAAPTSTPITTAPAITSPATTSPATTASATTTSAAATTTSTAATSAVAVTPTTRSDIGWAGIDLVDYPWRERFPDWTISVEAGRDGVRALTFPSSKRVEIYVRTTDTPSSIARVFAHELGHVVDIALNSEDDRQRWREARDAGPGVSWWPSGSTYDFDTLAGDFAEAFAVWKVGATSQSRVGGGYTPDQLAVLVQLAE